MKTLNETISLLLREAPMDNPPDEKYIGNLEQIGSFLSEYQTKDIKDLNDLLLGINSNVRIVQESPDNSPETEDALSELDTQLIDVISAFNEMLSASRTLSKLVTKTLSQLDKQP